ncbi:hypothetical protein D9758_007732 [Tetrapyrgos nigripes]|uniref:Type 1 phosphatases regulator n=1 Tax=Tetrapyrgos nigripes TaxID=182062 RepID=A0A8H5LIG9_9AGAR|nr:hypothetical protein D9758_007732 [Tetrapyrgos nigripes]
MSLPFLEIAGCRAAGSQSFASLSFNAACALLEKWCRGLLSCVGTHPEARATVSPTLTNNLPSYPHCSSPMASTRRRPNTSAPGDGSRTITITGAPPNEQHDDDAGDTPGRDSSSGAVGTLRLHGATKKTRQKVVWSDDVVDNEGCGKKSSKICCIYHKPKAFDESSSEEDSSDSDDSDCEHGHNHNHSHSHSHGHGRSSGDSGGGSGMQNRDGGSGTVHTLEESSDSDVNAYEAQPRPGKGKRRA